MSCIGHVFLVEEIECEGTSALTFGLVWIFSLSGFEAKALKVLLKNWEMERFNLLSLQQ